MSCPICGYHSGPLTESQMSCPRVHLYRPPPRPGTVEQDYAAAMDEKGADQIERENHEAGR